MARILYTVCGVGLGHASRSSIILKELMKEHDVKVSTYSDGIGFLKKDFPNLVELNWFKIWFKKNKINKPKTIAINFFYIPKVLIKNLTTIHKTIKKFKPEIIVSDFDINGLMAGKLFNLPVILISNLHTVDMLKAKLNFWEKLEFIASDERMLRAYDNGAKEVLVTSILKPKFGKKNFHSFYPIINSELLRQKTFYGKKFLVYMSKENLKEFLPLLKEFETEKFIVYGFGSNELNDVAVENIEFLKNGKNNESKSVAFDNIEFRKFSTKEWQKDIAECSGVLCHGGLLTLSEAVVLKKPAYVFAAKNWFERFHNGKVIEKMEFGMIEEIPTIQGVKKFIESQNFFKKNLEKENIKADNEAFLKKLNELIEESVKTGKY